MTRRVTWWVFVAVFFFGAPALAAHGVELKWQAVEGAAAYEVEISSDPNFENARAFKTPRSHHTWQRLPRRPHYWRVRTVDASGRIGPWSAAHEIPAFRPTPSLLAPANGLRVEFVDGLELELKFKPGRSMKGMSHRVEVALDESFDDVIWTTNTEGRAVTFQVPAPGEYAWRVRPNVAGEKAVSTTSTFAVDAPPPPVPAPVVFAPREAAAEVAAVATAPESARRQPTWYLGAHTGVSSNLALLRAVRFGVDWTLRTTSGWTLAASIGDLYSSQSFEDVTSTLHLPRGWVGAGYTATVGNVGVAALVGPTVGLLLATVEGPATVHRPNPVVVPGVAGAGEVSLALGPGELWLSVGLEWAPADVGVVSVGSRRTSALAGYRLEVGR